MEDSQEAAASSVDPQKIQKAEELRLEGNAAFSAKKWNGAVKKYRASIDLDGSSPASAKVYSNLAAALCKLSKYDDAHEAAKKATEVDPDWAKGHWRLGVVNELQKDFLNSISCYMRASDLDPNEGTFVKAKEKMMKRLGCTEKKDADGNISMHVELPPTSTSFQGEIPALIAWSRLLKRTNNLANTDAYLPKRWEDKSEHWLQNALYQWYRGMFKQLGQLADLPDSKNGGITEKVEQLKLAAHAGQISVQQFSIAREKITGVPTAMGQEMDELMTGLTLLMGDHIPMETRDDGKERFVPSPPWLKHIRQKQMIAIQDLLCRDVLNLKMTGKNKDGLQVFDGRKSSDNEEMIVISPGLLAMANSFWAGTCGNESGIVAEEGTPEDVVAYIKKRLKGGVTWDENNGMRKYVSVVYRGTVLSAWLARVTLGLGIASRYFRWANKFIDLVDEEWKVTQSGDYSKYGNSFRKSFRVSILAMELQTAHFNRDHKFTSRADVLYEFNLAQKIISYAKEQSPPTTTDFSTCNFYTSFSRKPMAFALSLLGSCMHTMLADGHHDMFEKIIEESGMMDFERDDSLISFLIEKTGKQDFSVLAMIAETYHVAAETQLPDDGETAILWWGYSAHICYAGDYKLKDLRNAVNKAIIATQQRDDDLWGPSVWRGSAHQKLSLLVARYFQERCGNFVLPRVDRSGRPDGSLAIFCGDHLICPNFDRAIRLDNERQEKEYGDYFDTAEIEQEHGAEAEIEQEQEAESQT